MKHLIRNTEQVQALLNGATQTREIIHEPIIYSNDSKFMEFQGADGASDVEPLKDFIDIFSPYKIGDEVFIKEKFTKWGKNTIFNATTTVGKDFMDLVGIKWKPLENMTEKESRFTLKIINVRIERLQDLSEEDALKSGINKKKIDSLYDYKGSKYKNPETIFKLIWNESAKDGFKWDDNPYVFVYDFEIVEGKKQ